MNKNYYFFSVIIAFCLLMTQAPLLAQEKGQFSGDLEVGARFFEKDTLRGASNTPFYDYLFYGVDSWLNLNYRVAGFDMGMRFDLHHNSNRFNPTRETSKQGIGRWYIAKSVKKLDVLAGHIYEQFASGLIFRTYESRGLGIDQTLLGIRLRYHLTDNWTITGVTGKLKNQFNFDEINYYNPVVKGLDINGYVTLNDKVQIIPGFAIASRTIDTQGRQNIALEINSYELEDRFIPKMNTHAFTLYNTLNAGNFSWHIEGAYKTEDVLRNSALVDEDGDGTIDFTDTKLFNPQQGVMGYTSLTYSQKGLGIVLEAKYTENFDYRVSPNEVGIGGPLNFLPPLTRTNSYRLLARYNAATLPLGEIAVQGDVVYTPKKGMNLNGNFSTIYNLDNELLFREIYADITLKPRKKAWKLNTGLQWMDYNIAIYQQKGDFVHAITPFAEFVYKFTRKKSLKTEIQYMLTKRNYVLFGEEDPYPDKLQDFGDWFWLLTEFSIAPSWSFSVADMYAIDKNIHYPTFFVSYTHKVSRFALSYAKQPDGIICTGGICRYEPAFSGVKFDVTTRF